LWLICVLKAACAKLTIYITAPNEYLTLVIKSHWKIYPRTDFYDSSETQLQYINFILSLAAACASDLEITHHKNFSLVVYKSYIVICTWYLFYSVQVDFSRSVHFGLFFWLSSAYAPEFVGFGLESPDISFSFISYYTHCLVPATNLYDLIFEFYFSRHKNIQIDR